jgi:cell division protein FtsA
MIRHIIVGIDIGTYTTRVVVSEMEKGNTVPTVIGVGTSESRGLRHGYIINPEEALKSLRRALREAEKTSGIAIKRAYISIGGVSLHAFVSTGSAIISKADGEVTTFDIDKALRESEQTVPLQNRRIIFRNTISYKLDGVDVLGRPEGQKGVKLETKVLFVTALAQHIDDLESVVVEAGIEPIDFVPSSVAASHVALTDRQRMVGAALVNIGAETVSFAAHENDKLIGLHIFGIGSTDITNDIALGLRVPLEEAETIKLGTNAASYPKKKLDEIIEARLSDIFELIERYLKKIKRNELLPAGIRRYERRREAQDPVGAQGSLTYDCSNKRIRRNHDCIGRGDSHDSRGRLR